MLKVKKQLSLILVVAALSACTSIERFNTEKTELQATSAHTANLRIASNHPGVFAIPNSKCIALDGNVVKVIGKLPKRDEKASFLRGTRDWAVKEFSINSLGMPKVDLIDLNKKFDLALSGKTYASREFKINAGEPLTIFIKKQGSSIGLLLHSAETEYGFGYSFVPQKGHDYEVVMQSHSSTSGSQHAGFQTTYHYSYALFDITRGQIVNLTKTAQWARGCSDIK